MPAYKRAEYIRLGMQTVNKNKKFQPLIKVQEKNEKKNTEFSIATLSLYSRNKKFNHALCILIANQTEHFYTII